MPKQDVENDENQDIQETPVPSRVQQKMNHLGQLLNDKGSFKSKKD